MSDLPSSNITSLAVKIQSIPSPTFGESKRADFLASQFATLPFEKIEYDPIGNVYAKIKGGDALPLIISAHLDSVCSPDENNPIIQNEKHISGPGIGDNALGVAALIEIGRHQLSQKKQPSGDIWLVGNVAEEGLGNLAGMQQIAERFQDKVKSYLVLEGIGLGLIQTAALGIHRYKIEVNTQGGHAWSNFGDLSAIHELISLSAKILAINLPDNPRSSVNIGSITGGGSINSIASHAEMQIEIRSEDVVILESLSRTIHKITSQKNQIKSLFTISEIGQRPSGKISEKSAVILAAQAALRNTGITPMYAISSSDASLPISLGYQATCIGITTGRRVHTPQETIDLLPIPQGMSQIIHIIEHLWDYS